MKFTVFMMICLIGLSVWGISPVHATDASVTNCASFAGAGTISDAVAAANMGGGTITFNCGGTITFSSTLTITDDVVINANGNTVIFDGGDSTSFFAVDISRLLVINGFTLQNGASATGGAINNAGTLSVTNSTFVDNNATNQGGAIYNTGTLIVIDNTFTDNDASNQGGAIYNDAAATINNNTFTSNGALLSGGAIYNTSTILLNNNLFQNNLSVFAGEAIESASGTASSQDNHFENNDCNGTITNNGGNTVDNAPGCPGVAPIPLDVSPLACSGNNAVFTINAGDGDFMVDGTSGNFPPSAVPVGLVTLIGPATWTDITITELRGEREFIPLGGITCPEAVIIPPTISPAVTVLGCALDTTDGLDIFNAPDNTYCRILMKNGGVVSYSGAVPADLISLGVILAVDVYRLEGGASVNTFPSYARVCLAGTGRLFYMDARQAPRISIELASESVDGLTCGWIPAPGTLILTN
jgi:predicted outer membrane repeat protein